MKRNATKATSENVTKVTPTESRPHYLQINASDKPMAILCASVDDAKEIGHLEEGIGVHEWDRVDDDEYTVELEGISMGIVPARIFTAAMWKAKKKQLDVVTQQLNAIQAKRQEILDQLDQLDP